MKFVRRLHLIVLLLQQLGESCTRVVAFASPRSQPLSHKVSQSGLCSALVDTMATSTADSNIDVDTIMLTVAVGAVAYFSSYVTDGYETHAL